ncbi:unnamed protein product [Brugia timori]|uniref:Uncharacterized protein n=1 Tax=Brugia timori TaxID=42155 RepID=A0A0R3QQF8_9BILA|nr:unnamed protein product [Brugia timori]
MHQACRSRHRHSATANRFLNSLSNRCSINIV